MLGTGLSLAHLIFCEVGAVYIPVLQVEKLRFSCLPQTYTGPEHKAKLQNQNETETKALLPTSYTEGDWG